MKVNSEAIHGTRPWKVFGEGPTQAKTGAFQESGAFTAQDLRFTTKGSALYAIALGEPRGTTAIQALAASNPHERRRVREVRLLGLPRKLAFRQEGAALVIDVPVQLPSRHANAFKITFG